MIDNNATNTLENTENKFIKKLEEKVFPILTRMNNLKSLDAIREAVFSSLPLIILGLIVFACIGCHGMTVKERLLRSFSASLGLLGVWVSFYFPFAFTKKTNKTLAIISGILSFTAFITLFPSLYLSKKQAVNFLIQLSQGGVVFAFIISGAFVALRSKLEKKNNTTNYLSIVLLFLIFLFISVCIKKSGTDIFDWVNKIIKPLLVGADTLPAAMLVVFLMSLFWLAGIHGSGVVGGIVLPFYLVLFNANVAASISGEPMPYIITPPFFIWCMIGGTGATLPLSVYMLFSKAAHLKKMGKISILPALVNINEPLVFGTPLILNPITAIPFIVTPVILAIVNYCAIAFDLVDRILIIPIFTIPTPIYAYLSTLDWRAIILIFIDIAIAFAIYYPFFKALEKSELEREARKELVEENVG
jgi:PTS system cellobiose-specific IIC component